MASFEDLGLREALLRMLADEELEHPTALQVAVVPVLRRGGNLIARASAGSGKTLAYSLGVFDRLEPCASNADEDDDEGETGGPRVLVLVPTRETAERIAAVLFPFAQAVELAVTAAGGSWATPARSADVLVATPAATIEAVRGSALKLDEVEAVVIDGASSIQELGGWETVDTLLDHIPRDSQRILISAALTDAVEDLADRRIKRALRFPPTPALQEAAPPATGEIGYVLAAEPQRVEVLARLLANRSAARSADGAQSTPVLFCRTDERASDVAEALTVRGFLVGEVDDEDADIAIVSAGTTIGDLANNAGAATPGPTISYDVPSDEVVLQARHLGDPTAAVLLAPRELPHLRAIAERARLAPRAIPAPVEADAVTNALAAFREELRRALREEDLGAQMLVLEPLFDEWDAAEVAAAATALLRHRSRPAAAASTQVVQPPAAVAAPLSSASQPAETGSPPAPWARLYVGVGSRDEIRPGDLVGAIAGEANIPGSRIGRIDIRDNFSVVEVQADVAEQVIRAVNGTTIKGRSVRVDYDRGGDRGRKAGGREGVPIRRQRSSSGDRPPVRRPPTRE